MKKNQLISQVRRGSSSQDSEYTKTSVGRVSWCSLKSDPWGALLALLLSPPDHHLLIFHNKVTWFATCFWWEGVEFIFGMQVSQVSPQMSNPGISEWSGWPVRFFILESKSESVFPTRDAGNWRFIVILEKFNEILRWHSLIFQVFYQGKCFHDIDPLVIPASLL